MATVLIRPANTLYARRLTTQTGIGQADLDYDIESFYDYYFTATSTSPYYNFRVIALSSGTISGMSLRCLV